MVGKQMQIKGIVQGVGFRPYVYRKALEYALTGRVRNSSSGVLIDVEGLQPQLAAFERDVLMNPPPLAKISAVTIREKMPVGYTTFEIADSARDAAKEAWVPPDAAMCADCKVDLLTPASRYFRYPFTNCTNCGPRFTIVGDIPYDRQQTAMERFPMCTLCGAEYGNPANRRFHAQPIACPHCGPAVLLTDGAGRPLSLDGGDPFLTVRRLLRQGQIIALKSLGGFHLACHAENEAAVALLRQRKRRPCKPLAVMAASVEAAKRHCRITAAEETILSGPAAPIVILNRRKGTVLPEPLAPGIDTLGVMLPYTPLHVLLFDEEIELLVMSSGNISKLPQVKDNETAWEQLGAVADYFLVHNREIYNRCDDSLMRVSAGKPVYWRRSRGVVPAAVFVPPPANKLTTGQRAADIFVLGSGAESKNTFCLLQGRQAYLSQHNGELDSLEGMTSYRESLANFGRLLNAAPAVVGYDLHPGYLVSRLARELPAAEKIPVQHHHAHLASCMAENGLDEPVIGAILDGTGYGTDGNLWGFEILSGDYEAVSRQAQLAYVPLPGGERAVKNPWLTAVSYLLCHCLQGKELAVRFFPDKEQEIRLAAKMLQERINSPLSSGCGRLFDAFAALLGVCRINTYDGQAAIELGELASARTSQSYPYTREKGDTQKQDAARLILQVGPLFEAAVEDLDRKLSKRVIATKFHNTVVRMVTDTVIEVSRETGIVKTVLSGGAWQNEYLLTNTVKQLQEWGLTVYTHSRVPANDGGLSLGQAMVARRRWQNYVLGGAG